MKHVGRVATKDLPRGFQETAFRRGQYALNGDPGIINAILAANQVSRDKWPVDPGQHVVVHHVDLAKGGTHLADLRHEARRQCCKGDVAFFQVDAFLAE